LTGEVLPRTPAWSPDGTTIAYAAYGGTIETIRPDGSGHTTVASLPGAEIDSLAWSPTGKTIAFDARKTPPES
jgi:Tol biopolymer transport system component